MDQVAALSVRGRSAKQERSERTRAAIVAGAIEALAAEGVAGLTHRLLARRSGASLAATTYYFDSKQDVVAAASNELLRSFLEDFTSAVSGFRGGGAAAYRNFVAWAAANALAEARPRTLAGCEITLEGARHAAGRRLARSWFERLAGVWEQAARDFGVADPVTAARAGIDVTLGAVFHGLALGLDREALLQAFEVGVGALGPPAEIAPPGGARPQSARAAATRERILEAAIRLLASRGAGAVNCRSAALEAGLTPGAPAYHFASSKALLAEAQALLFLRSQARQHELMISAADGLDFEPLVSLLGATLRKEITDHAPANLAGYAIWLQAAREPELRPLVRGVVIELHRGWGRILAALGGAPRGPEPLLLHFRVVGAQIRAMAAGVRAEDAAQMRTRLRDDLSAMVEGRHWLQS